MLTTLCFSFFIFNKNCFERRAWNWNCFKRGNGSFHFCCFGYVAKKILFQIALVSERKFVMRVWTMHVWVCSKLIRELGFELFGFRIISSRKKHINWHCRRTTTVMVSTFALKFDERKRMFMSKSLYFELENLSNKIKSKIERLNT